MKKITYFAPNNSSFVKRDITILAKCYRVRFFALGQKKKYLLPFQLIQQFFQCLVHVPKSEVVICHFAGYSSFIPLVLGRLFKKKRFLIIAGTDAASFPSFNYGNFRAMSLMRWVTEKSLLNASHILPVHESLAFQPYNYHESGGQFQGYQYFCPASNKITFSPLNYSFDSELFRFVDGVERINNSFISVGNLAVKTTVIRKGFDLIIAYAKQNPHLSFTLVGWDGAVELNVTSNVKLLPFLKQDELVQEFNRHQYYLQLSLMEGFPNALAESMLCGCVPIGSNVSGIPFIIGETGYVLNRHSLESLDELVQKIIKNDNTEKSIAARKRVVKLFNDEVKLKEFCNLIEKDRYDEKNNL